MDRTAFQTEPVMKWGLDKVGDGRFAVHTQTQTGQCDAQLGGCNVAVHPRAIFDRFQDAPRCGAAFLGQMGQPCLANTENGELRGDKQPVEQNEDQNDDQRDDEFHLLTSSGGRAGDGCSVFRQAQPDRGHCVSLNTFHLHPHPVQVHGVSRFRYPV